MSAKEIWSQYSTYISLGSLVLAAGVAFGSCGNSVLNADRKVSSKADAIRVSSVEVQIGKIQECLDGIKSRQERTDKRMERIEEKINRLLIRDK